MTRGCDFKSALIKDKIDRFRVKNKLSKLTHNVPFKKIKRRRKRIVMR